jgi:CelD/BcsL family acetyltransferase involved in cellulose biosynthesis
VTHVGVELAIGVDALSALVPLWERLAAAERPPPFQTWGWARAWLAGVGTGAEPWVATCGEPASGLLALALRRVRGLRVLSLMGHGTADYLGPLGSAREPAALRAIGRRLREAARGFDLVDLLSLAADDAQRAALAEGLGGRACERRYELCPFVRIDGPWDAYVASRSTRQRRHIKQLARRLDDPALSIATESAAPVLFEELVEVERASWKWEHGRAALRDPQRRTFLREVLLGGQVRHELWTCREHGRLLAFAIVLLGGRTRYYYLPSFRGDAPGVGNLLLLHLLRDSFSAGFAEFDFLQGDEAYKAKWANAERAVHQLVAAGGGWLGAPALAAVRGRWWLAGSPRLRRLRSRWLGRRSPAAGD